MTDNLTGASISGDNFGRHWGRHGRIQLAGSSNFVLGIEGTFDGTSISHTTSSVSAVGSSFQGNANTNWVSTIAGRIGIAENNWLYYVKGGGGWVDKFR